MFDHSNFCYFIQILPTSGTVSFSNYTDNSGNTYQAYQTYNKLNPNESRKFYITFSARERTYRTTKDRQILVSVNGSEPKQMKLVEFLKNSPFTLDSENLRGNPIIKLFDEVKDATVAVDRRKARIEAGNTALNLDEAQTQQVANLIGVFSDDKMVQKNRVLEFADQEPEEFMKLFNSPDREVKALIKKGLKAGVLKPKGKMILWETNTIGADEDEAVSKLLRDTPMYEAIKKAINKLK